MNTDLSSFFAGIVSYLDLQEKLQFKNINANGKNIKITEPIIFKGYVYRINDESFIKGDIFLKYKVACDRCLTEFIQQMKTNLSGKLMEKSRNTKSQTDVEDQQIIYYSNEEIDLTEAVITAITLDLPMKFICKEDCKGLCPKCGKNLNEGKCNCTHEDIDPRFEKLKELL